MTESIDTRTTPGRPSPPATVTLDVPAKAPSVGTARRRLGAFVATHADDSGLTAAVRLAVSEAVSNAVRHAYDAGETGSIHIRAELRDDELWVTVADDGHGLRPGSGEGLGKGLSIMATLCDELRIKARAPRGTEIGMRFFVR